MGLSYIIYEEDKGTGTRIKIIEAMLVGAKILTTKKGIEGISFKKKNFLLF